MGANASTPHESKVMHPPKYQTLPPLPELLDYFRVTEGESKSSILLPVCDTFHAFGSRDARYHQNYSIFPSVELPVLVTRPRGCNARLNLADHVSVSEKDRGDTLLKRNSPERKMQREL